jgi:hypothetical protein
MPTQPSSKLRLGGPCLKFLMEIDSSKHLQFFPTKKNKVALSHGDIIILENWCGHNFILNPSTSQWAFAISVKSSSVSHRFQVLRADHFQAMVHESKFETSDLLIDRYGIDEGESGLQEVLGPSECEIRTPFEIQHQNDFCSRATARKSNMKSQNRSECRLPNPISVECFTWVSYTFVYELYHFKPVVYVEVWLACAKLPGMKP